MTATGPVWPRHSASLRSLACPSSVTRTQPAGLTQLEGADRVSTDVNPDPPAKPGVSPAVIAAGAVAVLALVGFLGYQALTPKIYAPPMPANYKPDPAAQAFKTWAQQK